MKAIITQLTGGLGNQLFQYAYGKALAKRNKVPIKIDISFFDNYEFHEYSLIPFGIDKAYASKKDCKKLLNPETTFNARFMHALFGVKTPPGVHSKFILKEKGFVFNPDYLEVAAPKYLIGYWQTEKYFKEIETIIRQQFEIIIPPSNENQTMLDIIKNTNSISLHVRRGNYVTVSGFNDFFGTCSLDYYNKSIAFIKERVDNPVFFIFSNDMVWCKENMNFEGQKIFVDINDEKTDYEDLRLMQNCKHNIIANSTFSWWAAWLNMNAGKIVITPERWFANKEMQAKTYDLIPEGWIKL